MADMTTKILTVELKAQDAVNGIINLNNAIDKNTQQMKANSAQIKQNNKDIEKGTGDVVKLTQQNQVLAQSNVELAAKTKVLKDERRVLQKETQNEIKMQTEEEGSLKALRAELIRTKEQFDKLSRAKRETSKEGKILQEKMNLLTNEIRGAEFATQRYYRNVGNYQNAIMSAFGLNNSFAQSLISIGGSGEDAGNALEGMGGDAVRTTSALATLNVHAKALKTTLWSLAKNPAFLAVAAVVGVAAAAKEFYEYNVEVEHAMRLTREFTGVAGDELVRLRAEIQATASTYGKEYQEVLEGVDLLMTHFSMTSEQAMRTLNDGFMIGADINGNYLQLLKQYGPVFKDAGVSAEQLVALIQQTRSGIFSQQGLEAIKQASARLREMSKGTRESLQGIGIDVNDLQRKLANHEIEMIDAVQMVSNKLKEVGNNTQEYGNVMADVFGRQGKFSSQEMIESLGDIDTNLQNLKDSAGNYGIAMDENQQATADFEDATARFFGVGENGWETLKTKVDTYWKKALTSAINKTDDLIDQLKLLYKNSTTFQKVAKVIAGVIGVLTISVAEMIGSVFDGIKSFGKYLEAMVTTWKSAFNIIADLGRGAWKILQGDFIEGADLIASAVKKDVNNVLASFKVAIKSTKDAWGKLGSAWSEGYNASLDWLDSYSYPSDSDPDPNPNRNNNGNNNNNRNNNISSGSGGDKNKNKGKKGGGNKKTSSTKNNADAEAKKEKDRLERLAKELQDQADKIETKALQELAKTSESAINELYQKQKDAVEAKYKDLFSSGLFTKEQKEKMKESQKKLTDDLEKQRLAAVIDLQTKEKNLLLQNQIAATNDAKKRHELELQQLDNQKEAELKKIGANEELKNAIIANFAKKRQDMVDKFAKEQLDATQKLLQTQMEGQAQDEEGRLARHKQNLELLRLQQQEELAQYEKNEAMQLAIKEKYKQQELQLEQEYANKEREIQYQRYEAIAAVAGGLGQLMAEFQDGNKDALAASKILALAEIMISQAVAIANAVKAGSNATNPWQMIAQIATSVTAVTVAMVQAFKSLNSAKFATGGYIQGAGTSTSDSIPVRVSNGESIMNANTTAMFGGLLSSLNQLGGGVPIQVQETASSVRGEDMLARAVARGVAMLPAPVVSVQDINDGQRQVEVMNERATL